MKSRLSRSCRFGEACRLRKAGHVLMVLGLLAISAPATSDGIQSGVVDFNIPWDTATPVGELDGFDFSSWERDRYGRIDDDGSYSTDEDDNESAAIASHPDVYDPIDNPETTHVKILPLNEGERFTVVSLWLSDFSSDFSLETGAITFHGYRDGAPVGSVTVENEFPDPDDHYLWEFHEVHLEAVDEVRVTSESGGRDFAIDDLEVVAFSDNAELQALSLSDGELTPAFDPETTDYHATVGYHVDELTVTPTAVEDAADISVNGSAAESGEPTDPVELPVGDTTITVTVTSPNAVETAEYRIDVERLDIAEVPEADPPGGVYPSDDLPLEVTLSTASAEAVITWTDDGSTPSREHGTHGASGEDVTVTLGEDTMLQALAWADDLGDSPVVTAEYVFHPPLGLEDGDGEALAWEQTAEGGALEFSVSGGAGAYTASAGTNAAGVAGAVEDLGGGAYRFQAPLTGAFAGEYPVTVTDTETGWSETLVVTVPLEVAQTRTELLGGEESGEVTVRGAEAGTVFSFQVQDGEGEPDTGGALAMLAGDSATAEDDPEAGNPATVEVTAAVVDADADFRVAAESSGAPYADMEVVSDAITAQSPVEYVGDVYSSVGEPVAEALVELRDAEADVTLGNELDDPWTATADADGRFGLVVPAAEAEPRLRLGAPAYQSETVEAAHCTETTPCLVTLDFAHTAEVPEADPPGGVYPSDDLPLEVTLSTITEDAIIAWTVNGGEPGRTAGEQSEAGEDVTVTLTGDTTLHAMAWRNDLADSGVVVAEYVVDSDGGDGSADEENAGTGPDDADGTWRSGSGCTVATNGVADPLFPAMLLVALLYFLHRGRCRL